MLSLVALGRGVLPVGELTRAYSSRPDLVYVPLHDAPPIRRGPVWLAANTTARVRAFVQAAADANPQPQPQPQPQPRLNPQPQPH
ncbi:hypothetical protein [Streptomyces mayteni]